MSSYRKSALERTTSSLDQHLCIRPKERTLFAWLKFETEGEITASCIADLSGGTTLNKVVDHLILKVPRGEWYKHPANNQQRERNIKNALEQLRHAGIRNNLKPKDILKAEDPRILVLLENVFKFVLTSKMRQMVHIEEADIYQTFLKWINDVLKPDLQVHNFSDYWCSGKALAGLLDSLTGLVPDWRDWLDTGDEGPVETAMAIAEECGVQKWITAGEMVNCKGTMDYTPNIIYLSQFLHVTTRANVEKRNSSLMLRPGMAMRQTRIMQPRTAQMSMMGRGVRSIPPPEYSPNEYLPIYRPQEEILYTGQRQSLYLGEQAPAYSEPRKSTFMKPSFNQQTPFSGRQSQSIGRTSGASTRTCNNSSVNEASSNHHADQENISAVRKFDEDVDLRSARFHKPVSEEELWNQIPEHIQSNIRQPLEDMMVKGKLSVIDELHNGKFCRVYKIRFTHYMYGYQKLAAKTFKVSGSTSVKTVVDLLAEAEMMLHFKHDNVLEMSGFTFHEGLPYIMMPLMTNGDLHSYLINEDNRISLKDLSKFQMGVAAGMHYLHEQCGFVHRNLRTSNCLLDDALNVKIFNFRLARPTMVADEDYVVVADVMNDMPWRWMPPEILESYNDLDSEHIAFNFKTDVWQFAILCWEIDSYGEVPYSNMQTVKEVIKYLESGERLPQPEMMSDTKFEKIIWPCWYLDPEHRPSLGKIEKLLDCEDRLTKMYTELQDNALYDDIDQRRMVQDRNLTQPKTRLSETPV